jgi:aryl-alcohol dehydrogenase-like predicted oxidoreductase
LLDIRILASMRYHSLGDHGPRVSAVGLGCYTFGRYLDLPMTRRVVEAALDGGVTFLDTADVYGGTRSEEFLGRILGGRRGEVVLATKFGQSADLGYGADAGPKGGATYIRRAIDASLRRLRTDYIDLYQMHVPDPAVPIEDTLACLHGLVREGKVRYIGCSNFDAARLREAAVAAGIAGTTAFISAQNRWSLLEREAESDLVPAAVHLGLGVLPYFPLANGLLTGKVRRGGTVAQGTRLADHPHWLTEQRLATVEALDRWAKKHGRSLLEVAVGGLAARRGCASVITGASSAAQIVANAAASDWVPSTDDLAEIDAIAPSPTQPSADRRRAA